MSKFLVLSGLPASGKSTLGALLADNLKLPFFDKDHFLQRLFRDSVEVTLEARAQLSRQADIEFEAELRNAGSAVAASWWRHPRDSSSSGTVPWWRQETEDVVVEVHCVCSPQLAVARFMERARHPGHNDGRWSRAQLLANFVSQAELGPLQLSPVIAYNTENATSASQLAHLAQAVAEHFGIKSAA